MLQQLREIEDYDAIFFVPHPEDDSMTNINVASYKKEGEKIGGTEMGDFYDIILFRMDEDEITDLEKFEAILVEPRTYVSRMVKSDWYGMVAKKTTTSDKFVKDTFDNWTEMCYNPSK